jgi:hypothetical protein
MTEQKWNPGTLLKLSGSYWQTCALHTAVKLDLFTAIGEKKSTAMEIAQGAGLNKGALTRLLDALAAMHLIEKNNDKYQNTASATTFLSAESPSYIGYMIKHHHHLMDSWTRMADSIKTGKPNRGRASFSDEERESFLMGMFVMGMHTAPVLAGEIDLAGRQSLIDIGGGPGTFAVHFCLKNPELKATVYDLPATRPFAEKTIAKFGLSNRIGFMDGNYVEETIEGVHDVAWLSHILHGEGPDTCTDILKKAVAVLKPGGLACIHEFILEDTMDGPLFPALFSINMLLGTESGQSYSQAQLTAMLEAAGVRDIKRLPYVGPTESGVLIGTT